MYEAYSDYQSMMSLAEEIVTRCALAVHGKLTVDYQVDTVLTKYILELNWSDVSEGMPKPPEWIKHVTVLFIVQCLNRKGHPIPFLIDPQFWGQMFGTLNCKEGLGVPPYYNYNYNV